MPSPQNRSLAYKQKDFRGELELRIVWKLPFATGLAGASSSSLLSSEDSSFLTGALATGLAARE